MLKEIQSELQRLRVRHVEVSLDDEFEPQAGTLAKVELGPAYWHLQPADLLALLRDLPDRAGSERVRQAIERHGSFVWHGPSPRSRDT